MNELIVNVAGRILPATPYCLPTDATNALDTAKLWAFIIAGVAILVAIIAGGVSIAFSRRDGGHEVVATMGKILIGAILIGAATGIAGIFMNGIATNCIPAP
ncbi:hypothetical protein JVX92_15080 (plasmid) [Microbacterium hominis]|uniref:hypothetical protein n=1 Tax=Microbacterium hominis TaxID=162426 RepID=UPI001964120E|nr:hypothetical protein [Microbacterium hominis]QRY42304.1 hypothetical protein JVX92_15080 [Microbacterium hominis]